MSTWMVTFSALIRYAKEAQAAQAKLDDAEQEMQSAVNALMEYWQGDAAEAFRAEQAQLDGWFKTLIGIVSEYVNKIIESEENYSSTESSLASKIHS